MPLMRSSLHRWLTPLLFGLVCCPAAALCNAYWPLPNRRVSDQTGRYYVVVEREEGQRFHDSSGPTRLTLAERAANSIPVKPSKAKVELDGRFFVMTNAANVSIRKGDRVQGSLLLKYSPRNVIVSATGRGVAILDWCGPNYGILESNPALLIVNMKGETLWSIGLADLFGKDALDHYHDGMGGVWWHAASWIDIPTNELVIVPSDYLDAHKGKPIAVVSMETGKVRTADRDVILRAIAHRNHSGLTTALELASQMKMDEAKKYLPGIVEEAGLPIGARLRAAVFLKSLGDDRGVRLLAGVATSAKRESIYYSNSEFDEEIADATAYAIENLPALMGTDSLGVLRKVVKKYGYGLPTIRAFELLRGKAVPVLIAILCEEGDAEGQYLAAEALGRLGEDAKPAVTALKTALVSSNRCEHGTIAGAAARALKKIEPLSK